MNAARVHKEIVTALKAAAGTANAGQSSDSYTGSTHTFYAVPVPVRRQILKDLVRSERSSATVAEWLLLVDALIAGRSHEEKTMGAYLLGYVPEARKAAGFSRLNTWLSHVVGWAEVDALCQNIFQPEELLAAWPSWERFLKRLAQDGTIHKRRAALVFLTGPTTKSADQRLHTLAYQLIDQLQSESDILITKAISWLLRSMAVTAPDEVAHYVESRQVTLPKIAVRETRKKLLTGKKNG